MITERSLCDERRILGKLGEFTQFSECVRHPAATQTFLVARARGIQFVGDVLNTRIHLLVWGVILGFWALSPWRTEGQRPPDPLDASNVVWTVPSTNSAGSMPLGNGDIGINLWVEQDGDLLFYVSKTDAWDEHARLLKLGRIRVKLSPNPFQAGLTFRQELKLRQGEIHVTAGDTNAPITIEVWVDANDPVIRLSARGEKPFEMRASLELWRTQERALVGGEESGIDTFARNMEPVVYPDAVLDGQGDRVVWFHRNETSIWSSTLNHQQLADLVQEGRDPLLNRTFGGLMKGAGLTHQTATELSSKRPARRFGLEIYAFTAQTDSLAEWLAKLERSTTVAAELGALDSRNAHRAWWNAFWNRSWIRVVGARDKAESAEKSPSAAREHRIVSDGYVWQRFINACGSRGKYPVKFNGSIFTTDVPGRFDADYRQWGGCYWFQNTRLVYWPMLSAGDFDLMQPLFKMYRDMLPFAANRTRIYYNHGGGFFPETMHFWGAYHNGDLGYGWERDGEPLGRTVNKYIRFHWSSGLELSAMLVDYFTHTQDRQFLENTLAPMAEDVLRFYSEHYPREPSGRLLIVPAQSLETWWQCDNPLPEIAGLQFVLDQLLALPPDYFRTSLRQEWTQLRSILPAIPTRVLDGETVLAPGQSFGNRQNSENPELYAIFPFRLFGVDKPNLEMSRRTAEKRLVRGNRGWQQDEIQMAFLGRAEEARKNLVNRFATKHDGSRFPAFWGPNFDWVPDQDHGGNGLMALQSMLLQSDRRKILLFPAWPKAWDVEFKVHAPFQTTVEGVYRSGKLERLKVLPPEREVDIVQFEPQ